MYNGGLAMSKYRRRLMGLAALRQAFADDFVRVEYIENTSTAYIDTLIKPIANRRYVLDCAFTSTDSLQQNGCFEYINGGLFNRYHFGIRSNLTDFQGCLQRSIYNWQPIDTNRHIWEVGYRNVKFDNTTKGTTTNNNYLPDVTFCLFARKYKTNNTETVGDFCLQRVYSFKIYNGDLLVRDFIPMYQISKDLYGLWDRVKEEFYTSPNGVKFTGGERVIADADDNLYYLKNYVNVSNNQRKDLGFQPVGNDSWEGKFYFIGTGQQYILGVWNSQGQRQYGFMGVDNRQMIFLYNTRTIYNTLSYGNKTFTLKAEKNKFYIYDSTNKLIWNSSATYVSRNNPVRNFIVGHLNGSVYASNARMYYFKYMRGDNLVWDLIPVQRCSDKVWGVFCKVHNSFYESDGGTAFTGG